VRGCRRSIDHDLAYIVVKTSPELADVYRAGPYPFPPGSLVVKEEFVDAACTGLQGWTLMRKEAAGYDAAAGDWRWQRLDSQRKVVAPGKQGQQDVKIRRCVACHSSVECRKRDFTCAEP
jgi:hypothetical protein